MNTPALFTSRRPAALLALAVLLWTAPVTGAQELKPIQLPKPQVTGGLPLMQALHGLQDATAAGAALKLHEGKNPPYGQSVGYTPSPLRFVN
jgi:hypothetical protein